MSSVSLHNPVLSGLPDTFLKCARHAYTETERGETDRQTEKCKIKLECAHHFLTSVLGKKGKKEKEKEKIYQYPGLVMGEVRKESTYTVVLYTF